MVYSVCTFTRAEGPEQIARFVAETSDAVLEPDGNLATWPHRQDADAFFAARLRRR